MPTSEAVATGGTASAGGTKRPKNRRVQIAMAAAELFCAHGYHGVGIDEIAASVGISGPAVYRHFPTKYAILVEATRNLVDATLTATKPPPGAGDASARIDDVLGALARLAVERRRVGGLYQWEGRYLAPEHRAEFRAGLATLVGRLERPLRRLRPALRPAGADALARAALSVFGSVTTHRATLTKGRAEQTLCRAAWTLLRADPMTLPGSTDGAASGTARRAPTSRAGAAPPAPPAAPAPLAPRRETILTEALPLFRRFGYHAVGVDDIGRAAGINASSVYRYFPSKADLLAAACYRASERLAAASEAALVGATGPADTLARLLAAYVGYVFDNSDLVSVYLAENNNLPERDRHDLRKTQRLNVEEWVRLLTSVRTDLPATEARLLVHAAFTLVSDQGRAVRFTRGIGAEREITRLATTVLHA
jgi:AcrR family transcriptional regulator